MKQGAVGSPGRAKQIQHHAKGLAAGKGGVFHTAVAKLAKMKLTPIEQLHVASKVHEHTLNQMFPKQKSLPGHKPAKPIRYLPKHGGGGLGIPDLLTNTEKTAYHMTQLPLLADFARHPGDIIHPGSRVSNIGHQNVQAQKNFAEQTTGYREIEHIRQHPIAGSIALAGLLPFGRVGKLAELARNADRAEHVTQVAEDAKGLRKIALQRKAVRLGRRTSPGDAQTILEQERQNAIARATKLARKNPSFMEHLPGEHRPETGGVTGLKVREAMRGVKKVYKKQQELQMVERAKRTGRLAATQKGAKSFEELAAAQKALAGEMPRAPFTNFAALKPVLEDIKAHVDSLNMLPHDKNRLVNAIKAGVNGKVPAPAERKLIESVFGREVKQLSPEALKEHGIGNTITDVLNVPRAILSSADLSGALRQGLGAFAYDPAALFRGYHQTLHAAISQNEFERIMAEEVHGDPYYHMARADGVPITEIGQSLNQKEEAISSNLAEHLHEIPGVRSTPGVKQLAQGVSAVVKASDRNYVVLLNRTRMRLYKQMVEQAAANGYRMDGPAGEKLRKEIGDTVATLTGRGNLGKTLTAHRATFNALFFSPGLMKSRINLLNPVWYLHASPFARQERMKAGLRLYGLLSGILVLAKAAGARVSTDPTNADFGKIRIGNTRIDPAGGLTQYIRLVGQLYEGKITSSVTGTVEPLSNGPFKTSRGNVAQQFLRNKLAPVPGLAYDLGFGPGLGQKMTPKSVAGNTLVPLMAQDMWQITHANGPGGGPGMAAATFLPDLFGVGIQNYGGKTLKKTGGSSDPFGGSSGSSGSDYFGGSGGSSGSPYFP